MNPKRLADFGWLLVYHSILDSLRIPAGEKLLPRLTAAEVADKVDLKVGVVLSALVELRESGEVLQIGTVNARAKFILGSREPSSLGQARKYERLQWLIQAAGEAAVDLGTGSFEVADSSLPENP